MAVIETKFMWMGRDGRIHHTDFKELHDLTRKAFYVVAGVTLFQTYCEQGNAAWVTGKIAYETILFGMDAGLGIPISLVRVMMFGNAEPSLRVVGDVAKLLLGEI